MEKTIFTVSQLNLSTQKLLEGHFGQIWVEGELSNLACPTSGHFYFSLKDAKCQVRAAMFRNQAKALNFQPRNGLLVQVRAKVSLYPDRGDYQLIVEEMALAGDGLLRQAYEKLLRKLEAEGLFHEQWKQALTPFPQHIGVITSPTGAAIRDILSVLKRRFPQIPVSIYPTKVQGADAAPEIVRALTLANQYPICDVLILARGGGSLEDLWPFNEEIVARAIFASKIPIVSGVGHEVDFTIADFVADKRAPTPSIAAELISPHYNDVLKHFCVFESRIFNEMNKHLQYQSQRLDNLLKRLRHPREALRLQIQQLTLLKKRLYVCMQPFLRNKRLHFQSMLRALEAISPLATLSRGYAIVSLASTGEIIRSVKKIKEETRLIIKFADGEVQCHPEQSVALCSE